MNQIENNSNATKIYFVGVDKIINNDLNCVYQDKNIDDLRTSIKEHGLKQPLTVVKDDDKYKLIAGHRRLAAIKNLFGEGESIYFGNKLLANQVPVIFENYYEDEDEEFLNLIASNVYRKQTPEEIRSVVNKCNEIYLKRKELGQLNEKGDKRQILSKMTGLGERTIDKYLKDNSDVNSKQTNNKIQSVSSVQNKIKGFVDYINDLDMEEYGKTDRGIIVNELKDLSALIKKKTK